MRVDCEKHFARPLCCWACACALSLAALSIGTASAQEQAPLLPLPQLGKCDGTPHPVLPEKWRATYLMAPFTSGQLVLGDIEYDASLSAMRVRLHGVKRGTADLLVLGSNTYQIVSAGSEIRQCRHLGDTGQSQQGKHLVADAVVVEPVSTHVSVVIREKNSEKPQICSVKPTGRGYLRFISVT